MYSALKEAIWRAESQAEIDEDFSGNPPQPFAYCDEGQGKQWFIETLGLYNDLGIYIALQFTDLNGKECKVVYRAYEGGEFGVGDWWVNFYADYEALRDWKWIALPRE